MRKLVILALIFAFSTVNFAADCAAGEVQGETACVKCTSVPDGGIANCGTCTYASANKKITCTKCASAHFFASTEKKSCAACTSKCNGGDCEDGTATTEPEAVPETKCTSCLATFVKANDVCVACAADCNQCSAAADGDTDGKCTTCKDAFYKDAKNFCAACGTGCKTCSNVGKMCEVCTDPKQFVSRADTDGACLAACASTKGSGVLPNGQLVCSDYTAPVANAALTDIVVSALNNSFLNISSLCAPSSTSAEGKKAEQVGAVLVASLEAVSAIDVNEVRAVIKAGSKVSEADWMAKSSYFNAGKANWLNVPGSDAGLAVVENFKIPKGVSTLSFVCVNAHGVQSALKSVKLTNNATLNPSVRFSLTLNQKLNDTALLNLTCSIANVVSPSDVTLVKNNNGASCSAPKKRILQASTAVAYSDYFFEVPADQNNDGLADSVKTKLADVKTAVTAFAKNYNVSVVSEASVDLAPSGVTFAAPEVKASAVNITSSNFSVVLNTTAPATIYWVLVASKAVVDDDVLRGSSKVGIQRGKLTLESGNVTSLIKDLNASTAFDLWVYASNKYDNSKFMKNTNILSFSTTAVASFSGLLSIGTFVLLVLALFL